VNHQGRRTVTNNELQSVSKVISIRSIIMKKYSRTQCQQAIRRIPSVLLVVCALQSSLLQGREVVSAASVKANPAGKVAEPDRAGDRLSPAEFADPPVHTRPGCFWAWLNGSITSEQVTRDLEAINSNALPR
jgi:hypothetical protein